MGKQRYVVYREVKAPDRFNRSSLFTVGLRIVCAKLLLRLYVAVMPKAS